ncbi:MAG: aminotransferase class IV, partial [Candidatus Micrarchaeaceae archaeon]
IFLVKDGTLITPDKSSAILLGITRKTVIELAGEMGIKTEERAVHREELYTADELFFSGTAAEITPIVNVDGIEIGDGKVGRSTKMILSKYQDVVHGRDRSHLSWLTFV